MSGQRTVSVLFSDVVGSSEVRSTLGDQRADELFGRHHRSHCAVVAEHAGTVVKPLGVGLTAVLGRAVGSVTLDGLRQHVVAHELQLHDDDSEQRWPVRIEAS